MKSLKPALQKARSSWFSLRNRYLHDPQSGFTMIELIMVMTIIGALAGIMILNFPATLRKSRDANRKSDLRQYATALEIFASKNNGKYPRESAGPGVTNTTLCTDIGLTTCPSDPKTGETCSSATCDYYYQTESCGTNPGDVCATKFLLWTILEQPEDPTKPLFYICSSGKTGFRATAWGPNPPGNCP